MLSLGLLPFVFFVILFVVQRYQPKRHAVNSNWLRQINNLALFAFNALILWLTPVTLSAVAWWAQKQGLGLFQLIAIPVWLSGFIGIVLLDFAVYWQHVATHKFDFLWRFHRVHHADLEMDVTTAVRFHPIELLLSLAYKSAIVIALGVPLAAVIVFELLLLLGAEFSHSNWALPKKVDRYLRLLIVTPDVHRSHHSIERSEQDSNYGFFLIWWDKLFSTYTHHPKAGHQSMPIGLAQLRTPNDCEPLSALLALPFKKVK